MKKKTNTNKESENAFSMYFKILGDYVKSKYAYIIIFAAGFLVVSVLNFLNISTSQSIANFAVSDFEIGQIADRTIIANKTLQPDSQNPVSVKEGEKIIRKGFAITENDYAKLQKMAESPVYFDFRAFADGEIYLFLIAVMWYLFYLLAAEPRYKKLSLKEPIIQIVFFSIVYGLTVFGSKFSYFSNPFAINMIIPASLCSILITILFGQIPAIFLSIIMSLGVLQGSSWELVPFIHTLASSLVGVAIVRKIDKRIDLVVASILLAFLDFLFAAVMIVIFNETFTNMGKALVGVAFNGFMTGILTLGFLTPLEYILNTASVFRLMDLSDLNNPLMRKMCVNASGTYQHSMMVAQLAESGCRSINANPLIARVGAYYHDIGKIDQSEYFVENQTNGENKHNEINPSLSVSVIKSHVKKGVEKAHQLHLPQPVIDIIAEHHGNSVISYFYNEIRGEDPNAQPEDFSYSGNPPSTRESAVVMLADTVEAACRTLENPTAPRLEKFINTLVTAKIDHHQLDKCDLTFADMAKVKDAFVQILAGHYHNRIKYQDQQNPDEKAENKSDSKSETESSKE